MTKLRHDLMLQIVKLMDAALVTVPSALCWYLYYAQRVASPFYKRDGYLVVALFFILYITFGRVYDAFLMSMQRISELVYGQFLAAGISDFIMYIAVSYTHLAQAQAVDRYVRQAPTARKAGLLLCLQLGPVSYTHLLQGQTRCPRSPLDAA